MRRHLHHSLAVLQSRAFMAPFPGARLDRTVGAGKVLFAIEERQASIVGGELMRPPRSRGEELVSHER